MGPDAEFCPTASLQEAGVASAAGDSSADAGDEEAGLVPAACTGGGRVLNAVKGEGACKTSLEGVGESMPGLPLEGEADCKDGLAGGGMSGTPVFGDLLVPAGADAETVGLGLVGVLCTGMPEVCGLATATGAPIEAGVAGKGLRGEVSDGVDAMTGILIPVTMDSTLIGAASLLLQEEVP